jgi:tight adherence protein C
MFEEGYMQLLMQLSVSIALGIAGLVAIVLGVRWLRSNTVDKRLVQYVETPLQDTDSRVPMARQQPRMIQGSFFNRTAVPAIKAIGRFFGRITPSGAIESISQKLMIAGNPMGLGAREYYGITMASTLLGVYLAFMFIRRGTEMINVLLSILILIFFYYAPKAWLQNRVTSRQNKVRKGLPDALDMLSVCATAGLGFDQSLQRVSEYWDTAIGHEFGRVINEMEMGVTRRDALRNLSDRLEIREIASFVALILQTEQLGMSISDTLHAQAEQMRIERRFRAQEQAQKAPIKMLIPMALLIFPALIAVILGPAIPTLMEVFNTM